MAVTVPPAGSPSASLTFFFIPCSIATLNWSSRLSLGVSRAIFTAGRKRPARFRPATPAPASRCVRDSCAPPQVGYTWDPLLSLCLYLPHGRICCPLAQVAAFPEPCGAAARTTAGTCQMKPAAARYPSLADGKPRSTGESKTWPKGGSQVCWRPSKSTDPLASDDGSWISESTYWTVT